MSSMMLLVLQIPPNLHYSAFSTYFAGFFFFCYHRMKIFFTIIYRIIFAFLSQFLDIYSHILSEMQKLFSSAYGFEDGLNDDGDETLSPLQRLQKLLESDNIFNRQMVARSLLDTLRSIGDSEEDCQTVLKSMVRMSEDGEPSVRSELMEQVPHVVVYCGEKFPGLADTVPSYILPMVAHLLDDGNDQVRKTSEAALLVLLEQGLVEKNDIEEKVIHVILDHASNSIFDFVRTEAVALLCKMAPLLGKDISERLFLARFSEFCIDPLFNVRKVCAANFGEFCNVVGTVNTEAVLLPKFYYLCEDGVWGVRKACAECFMAVSSACSLDVRRNELANLFVQLLCDTSRWVRMSAFQQLGPFISTFADPRTTGLLLGEDGTLTFRESLDQTESERSMKEIERMAVKADEEGSGGEEDHAMPQQRLSPRERRINRNNSQTPPCSPTGRVSLQLDPSLATESSTDPSPLPLPPLEYMEVDDGHSDDPEAELEFVDTISVLQADEGDVSFEERRAEKWQENKGKRKEPVEKDANESAQPEKKEEGEEEEEEEGGVEVGGDKPGDEETKSESSPEVEEEKSVEQVEDKNNCQREPEEHEDQSGEMLEVAGGTEQEQADPATPDRAAEAETESPEEEMKEEEEKEGDAVAAVAQETAAEAEEKPGEEQGEAPAATKEEEASRDSEAASPSETMFNSFQFWRSPLPAVDIDLDLIEGSSNDPHAVPRNDSGEPGKIFTTEVNLTLGGEGDSGYELTEIHTANINTLAEEMVTNIGGSSLLEPSLQNVQDVVELVHNLSSSSLGYMDSDVSPAESEREGYVTDASLAQQQNIVPQTLLESYLGMVDPSRAQTVDTEITRHCAYNLPAVALTLGRQNWHCIKNLYDILAQDIQWKVRRTLAFSIHELALILGEEITHTDLVPVFDSFLRDVDEVRIGVLKHFADFLRLLHSDVRRRYLGRIQDFLSTDNNRYWRFRLELTEQLVLLCDLYSAQDISNHMVSLSITLCLDKVAAVRHTAFRLLSTIIRRMHESGEEVLTACLTQDLIERFASNEKWLLRQTFAQVCQVILEENSLPAMTFAKLFLPALLELGKDRIPNVRLALARTLSQNLLPLEFFTSQHNPHQEELVMTLQGLQSDSDRDVRHFASLPPPDTASLQSQYQTVS